MKEIMSKVVKLFWHDSDETNLRAAQGSSGRFDLMLGTLLVGTLLYANNQWTFSYSEAYKDQTEHSPLVNFPQLNKEYQSNQLWPFFASRLPGTAQLQKEKDLDPVSLLKKYGKHVITNPYTLETTEG